MVDHDALLAAFATYSEALLRPYLVADVLHRLTDQVVDVLGVDGAGVAVARDDSLALVAATDERVAAIETQQESAQEGPCHAAYRSGEQVAIPDLVDEARWPAFREVALDEGARAVAGLPMPVGERRIGALNLFRRDVHHWAEVELQTGQVLANMASGYILNHSELSAARDVVGQLQHALDSRVVIEQAKGIVAAQRRVTPVQAFEVLRRHARSTNTSMHDVCRRVVDTTEPPRARQP